MYKTRHANGARRSAQHVFNTFLLRDQEYSQSLR